MKQPLAIIARMDRGMHGSFFMCLYPRGLPSGSQSSNRLESGLMNPKHTAGGMLSKAQTLNTASLF